LHFYSLACIFLSYFFYRKKEGNVGNAASRETNATMTSTVDARVDALEALLVKWKNHVIHSASRALDTPLDPAAIAPSQDLLRGCAVHLAGIVATTVVRAVIERSARRSEWAKLSVKLKHAELAYGYPLPLFLLCLHDDVHIPKLPK